MTAWLSRRTTAFGVAAVAVALGFGCASADVLDDASERGALRFGHRLDAPPFSYGEPGAPKGLAVALCLRIADAVGEALGAPLPVEWTPVSARDRFAALGDGRIDLLCGPTTQTIERRRRLDFSIPYFIDGAGAVFRSGGAERLRDLRHEPVGALAGTTTERVVLGLLDRVGASSPLILYESHRDGLDALQEGEIEAYFADQSILHYQIGQIRPRTPIRIARRTYSFEPYALAMRRGETRLRLIVDDTLSRLYESGAVIGLVRQTLGRVDLSEETRAIYDVVTIPE